MAVLESLGLGIRQVGIEINGTALELHQRCIPVAHDLEFHTVQIGKPLLPVIRILRHGDAL